jgi:hypothetical protein
VRRATLALVLAALMLAFPAAASARLPSPTTNVVTAQGSDWVQWDWDYVWGRESYVLFLSDDDGKTWTRHPSSTSALRVSGLDPCKTYIAKVVGVNRAGEGLVSREVEGKPTGPCAPPPPPPKAKCANGLDDDGDGLADLADPGCSGPTDDDEANVLPPPSDPPPSDPPPSDPTVTIAGDIAGGDSGTNDEATADVIGRVDPTQVLAAGDNAYPDGTLSQYRSDYDPSWGRFKAKTWPVPGNHEYHSNPPAGYFDYFDGEGADDGPAGPRAKGYYARDLGRWRIYALNSNIDMQAGSAEEQWLRQDLAANAGGKCVLAYMHHPRFNSGAEHGPTPAVRPLWQALSDAGADVVVAGHEHVYERFGPQDPDGNATPNGIRAFTVGTGGGGLYSFGPTPAANSEVREASTYGVLKLTLEDGSYAWRFEPVAGRSFTDEGSGTCHG